MDLKQMRIDAGYSQKQLAELCGINLRSLQDYEQGHKLITSAKGETLYRLSIVLGCNVNDILKDSCETILIDIENNNHEQLMAKRIESYQNLITKRKTEIVYFPIIEEDNLVDMGRIYPTKQHSVKCILNEVRNDSRISSLYLFGSSISMACHKDSDIDLAVGLKEFSVETRNDISQRIQSACDWEADILWLDHLQKEERVYNAIMRGVVLI